MKRLEVTQESSSLSHTQGVWVCFFFVLLHISLCTKMLFFACFVWVFLDGYCLCKF